MKNKNGVMILSKLERRIIDISYKHKLSHIGSCLTAVRLIDHCFLVKEKDDIFILSSAHSSLALYVILEKEYDFDAEELFLKHGVHCNRDLKHKIYASGGSLGHGIGIAVGMAITNRNRNIYVLMTDAECAEGSVWEALRIAAELRLENLRVLVNANGYSGNGKIDTDWLDLRLQYFYPTLVQKTNLYEWPDYMQGLTAHYHVLTKKQYEELTALEKNRNP